MGTVPKPQKDRIAWYLAHVAPWTSNATAIGTSSSAVTDLNTKITAAQTAMATATAAKEASKAATTALDDTIHIMSVAGAAIIKNIRAKAEITGGDSVYSLAQIPPPGSGTPTPPPGPVTNFKVTLDGNGALNLKWKCNTSGASGTIYQIWRKLDNTGDFAYLGGVGTRAYVDDSVPQGTAIVTYQIQGVRTTSTGPWAQFNVVFGMAGGSSASITVTEGQPTKIAA